MSICACVCVCSCVVRCMLCVYIQMNRKKYDEILLPLNHRCRIRTPNMRGQKNKITQTHTHTGDRKKEAFERHTATPHSRTSAATNVCNLQLIIFKDKVNEREFGSLHSFIHFFFFFFSFRFDIVFFHRLFSSPKIN